MIETFATAYLVVLAVNVCLLFYLIKNRKLYNSSLLDRDKCKELFVYALVPLLDLIALLMLFLYATGYIASSYRDRYFE